MRRRQAIAIVGPLARALAGAALFAACAAPSPDAPGDPVSPECGAGATRCTDNAFQRCDGGRWTAADACGERTCDEALGCVDCSPGATRCDGGDVLRCRADGRGEDREGCDHEAGLSCISGVCEDLCAAAAATFGYLGCEFWPTVTPNPVLGVFDFAVVVGNPHDVPVTVSVDIGSEVVTRTIAAGEVAAIDLPWVDALKAVPTLPEDGSPTRLVAKGAYRLTSSLPVNAYQFNPLRFMLEGQTECDPFSDVSPCSTTNDASLLLPTSALGTRYMALSMPTAEQLYGSPIGGPPSPHVGIPGFYAVVGTTDGTKVTITSSAFTEPGEGIGALAPGETAEVTLGRGDVLLVSSQRAYEPVECSGFSCLGGPEVDLTGTRIEASAPVAVIGGHPCSYVPFDAPACDHLEETLLPLDAWGTSAVTVSTHPTKPDQPNVWKIVAGEDAIDVTFDPPVHEPVTLGLGEHVEVMHAGGFRVGATGRILVGQLMVGDDYGGPGVGSGDPSLAIVAPPEQHRRSYDFLAPATYLENWVDVVAPADAAPVLDGTAVGDWTPIGETGFKYARVQLDAGAHHVEDAGRGFGIMVYGTAWYTSYLFPGGLDAAPIEPK